MMYENVAAEIKGFLSGGDYDFSVSALKVFDEVREAAGVSSDEWPQGFIHQAAIDCGLTVEL